MNVRIFIGANAYACIDDGARKTDILLAPGKGPIASLREYAESERARALRILETAAIADRAADCLEKEKASSPLAA